MVLQTFNQTGRDGEASGHAISEGAFQSQTIHGMLQFWAAETPYAPAARFEVGSTTCRGCPHACTHNLGRQKKVFRTRNSAEQLFFPVSRTGSGLPSE